MKIGLRAARVNAGFTQKEAAERLEISRSTLANYEMSKTKPDIDTAIALAKLYGVPIDNLIFLPPNCA